MAAIQPDEIEAASGRISLPPWPFLETLPAALDGEDRTAAFRQALADGDANL